MEGDAEYILLEEFYKKIHGKMPYEDDVNIISVDGKLLKGI